MLQVNQDVVRIFDLDYLIFDILLLFLFISILIIQRKIIPLFVGFLCGIMFLIIDGIIWWNTGVREIYPSNLKLAVDFMMDFSYGF